MYAFIIFCLALRNTLPIHSKTWIPKYENENTFNEPYDYVDEIHSPNFLNFGNGYDWIGVAGTSLLDKKKSYIAFAGTRKNINTTLNSVYTKQSGIIVLCSSILDSSNLGFQLPCKILEENHLNSSQAKYFGAVVKSVKSKNDKVAFIYCDPLWIHADSKENRPSGKCKLTLLKDFENMEHRDFTICENFKSCLGGFSVDIVSIDQDINIIFGLPFVNSTNLLNRAESYKIIQGSLSSGNYSFGYSVAFSGDGIPYVSSPVNDGYSPYVTILNAEKFYPIDIKSQSYGGFGTSIDTIKVGNSLYGVVIGAPYQSKQNIPNVGAVFLTCKGHLTHMISGENAYDYFGYSVARLGDINFDNSEEFVVSSPSLDFEKPGKIYIYGTSKDCQISKKPLQIYQSKINGFGISISRGFDINFNNMPDFFVTALGYQKPLLFKMPDQVEVTCSWIGQDVKNVLSKDSNFEIQIIFNTKINYTDYSYQVAIDFLNKDEPRFKLINSKLMDNTYSIKLQVLQDVQDMDLKHIPLKVAIRGIRPCKTNNNEKCYESKVAHVNWLDCEKVIKLSQFKCHKEVCSSDLNMIVKPDPKGSIIYYGEQKYYQRTIEVTINNIGPDSIPRIYMSINTQADLLITNVQCFNACKKELTATGQNAKIIIKESYEPRESEKDDFKMTIDVLYNKLDNVSAITSINFNISGVNEDNNIQNNNYTMLYSVLFKPDLNLSPIKTKEIIIDSRIKPPYLETDTKRISIQELGTELNYSYIIENKGPELKNVNFKFHFPYKTENNNFILYIMKKIRLSNERWQTTMPSISNKNGFVQICEIAEELLNPLNLIGMDNKFTKSGGFNRMKRASFGESDDKKNIAGNSLPSPNEKSSRTTLIKCKESSKGLGVPICAEITCKLNVIPKNSTFTFNFRTWLFTKTFFDARIADLSVVTALQSDLGDLIKGIRIADNIQIVGPIATSQNVLFNKMKIAEDKPLSIWPIIVAIIIGIFLLVIIIVIAYYCGFFKRKRLRKERQKNRERAHKNEDSDHAPLNATC